MSTAGPIDIEDWMKDNLSVEPTAYVKEKQKISKDWVEQALSQFVRSNPMLFSTKISVDDMEFFGIPPFITIEFTRKAK